MIHQQIESAIDKVIKDLTELKSGLHEQPAVQVAQPTPQPEVAVPSIINELDTFDKLKEAVNSPKWPDAVNKNLICNPDSEQDKLERGRGILELMIEEDLKGLKLLDAGCGEGHCAFLAQEFGTTLSVGYDIREHASWKTMLAEKPDLDNKVLFTNNYDAVKAKSPYDVIVAFDVLDHIEKESPVEFLKKLKDVLSDSGKLYLRCHPWTSRHATHLYHSLNKAYIHIIFTEEELRQLVPFCKYEVPNIKVITPIATYGRMIAEAGLKIVNRRDIQEKIEPFFRIPKIAERIMKATKFENFPEFQLSLCFVDMVIQKA